MNRRRFALLTATLLLLLVVAPVSAADGCPAPASGFGAGGSVEWRAGRLPLGTSAIARPCPERMGEGLLAAPVSLRSATRNPGSGCGTVSLQSCRRGPSPSFRRRGSQDRTGDGRRRARRALVLLPGTMRGSIRRANRPRTRVRTESTQLSPNRRKAKGNLTPGLRCAGEPAAVFPQRQPALVGSAVRARRPTRRFPAGIYEPPGSTEGSRPARRGHAGDTLISIRTRASVSDADTDAAC